MFRNALTYPKNGPDALKTILIGGVLTLLGSLVIPLFLVVGYTVRVARSVADGEEAPPVFDRWGDLLVDGAKGFAVTVVYVLVPTVILAAAFGVAATLAGGRGGTVALVGALLAVPVLLGAWYVATAAFVDFATTGRSRAGFDAGALRPVLASGTFATAWVVGLLVLVVGTVVGAVGGAIPLVGVLAAFVTFYTSVAVTYCYARGFAESASVDAAPEPDEAELTA